MSSAICSCMSGRIKYTLTEGFESVYAAVYRARGPIETKWKPIVSQPSFSCQLIFSGPISNAWSSILPTVKTFEDSLSAYGVSTQAFAIRLNGLGYSIAAIGE